MTTLLKSKDGKRRCDEKCYNAVGDYCDCICEGENHGVGLTNARVNITTMDFAVDNPDIEIQDAAYQLPLPFPFFR